MEKKKNNKKLRILVNSNAPWSTSGYAQQVRQFLPLMAKEGYATACSCFYGLEGGILDIDGIKYYPKIGDTWGMDACIEHSKHFNADVVFTLQDIWVLPFEGLKALAQNGKRWIPIVPIDHEPVPPAIHDRLKLAYRVVSYAPFGYEELKRVGMHSTYINHTVQTDMFRAYDKKEMRKALALPEDMFIFGMVAANKDNPPRKSFQHVLDAFKMFHDKHPNSGLYIHTLPLMSGGFQIQEYATLLGLAKNIFLPPSYKLLYEIPASDMAKIYSSMDCLLSPSLNEGFGVPIIEAMACEVPAIVNDFTAMRDLVIDGETGYKTKVAEKRFTPIGSYCGVPSTDSIYDCMEKVFATDRVKMGKNAREFVMKNFELETTWETKWKPFLAKLEKEIYPDSVDEKTQHS